MNQSKLMGPPINSKLFIVFDGEFAQNKAEHIEYLLELEDNVIIWIRACRLKPTKTIYYSVYGETELVRSLEFKANQDEDSRFTLQFARSEHANDPYRLLEGVSSASAPFSTIRIPLKSDPDPGIETNRFVIADMVFSACEKFKLEVANRLGLSDVYKSWGKRLGEKLPDWHHWTSEDSVYFKRVDSWTAIAWMKFCEMLDLDTYEEFETAIKKQIEEIEVEI